MQILADIASAAGLLNERGWAESRAGNISCRVITDSILPYDDYPAGSPVPLPRPCPSLAGQALLITGSGTRMRDIARDPASNLALLRISADGESYIPVLGLDGKFGREPSTELPVHLAIQAHLEASRRSEASVVHTHPAEIIAITQHHEYSDELALNRLIWSMHPEIAFFLPDGIGLLPYEISATQSIADATVASLNERSVVVWAKHGILAVGETSEAAFDMIDAVIKAVRVYFICKSAGYSPQGLTFAEIEELRDLGRR